MTPRILLFVSSTFRDLKEEREELVRRALPRVREFCAERGVVFDEVDLRWGITVEQAESGQIVGRCFHEIDRCRPFFLGLLGDRYGWVPNLNKDIPESLTLQQPWLRDEIGTSVTELEFLYGALREEAGVHAWFYSRQAPGVGGESARQAAGEPASSQERLDQLKDRLRRSPFLFREGFADAEALGDLVYADLTAAIAHIFPQASAEAAELERARHRSVADRYSIGFAGRDNQQHALGRMLRHRSRCVAIVGPAGAGKAALACHWAKGRQSATQQSTTDGAWWRPWTWRGRGANRGYQHIVLRIAGVTESSRDVASLSYSLVKEIRDRMHVQRPLPRDPATAAADLPSWLAQAGAVGPMLLVVAGLDRIESDPQRALSWLPCPAPPGVDIVITADFGRHIEHDESSPAWAGWQLLRLGPLREEECHAAVDQSFAHVGKHLPTNADVVRRMASRLPRFVSTFVEAMRSYGEFGEAGEALRGRIDWLLESVDERELYQRVVKQCEIDFDRDRPGLVRDSLALLAASHNGLMEHELLELLGQPGRPVPQFLWTPVRASLRGALVDAGGLVRLAEGPMRELVERQFLSPPREDGRVRQTLIDYGLRQPASGRKVSELLWQWARLGSWQEMAAWLGAAENWTPAWITHEFVLKRYFQRLHAAAGLSAASVLNDYLALRDPPVMSAFVVCQLLDELGEAAPAARLSADMYGRRHQLSGPDHRHALELRARVLLHDSAGEALEVLREEEALLDGGNHLAARAANAGNQAIALRQLNRLHEAAGKHTEEERLARALGDLRLLAGSLNNQSQVDLLRGNVRSAAARLAELERLARTLQDVSLVARALECRGLCLAAKGRFSQAARQLRDAAAGFHEAADRGAEARCLLRLAEVEYRSLDWDAAGAALDDAESAARADEDDQLVAAVRAERERLHSQFAI